MSTTDSIVARDETDGSVADDILKIVNATPRTRRYVPRGRRSLDAGEVHPAAVLEFATVIASLASGYLQRRGDGNIVDSIRFTISQMSRVLNLLEDVLDRIDDVLRSIDAAVKLIQRDIRDVEMTSHLVRMGTEANVLLRLFRHLNGVPAEQNNYANPIVKKWIDDIYDRLIELENAVAAFASLDGGLEHKPPTIATIFNCASSVALWARAYQLADAYLPEGSRIPIWDDRSNLRFKVIYEAFFDDTQKQVDDAERLLAEELLIPVDGATYYFSNEKFVKAEIPFKERYRRDEIERPSAIFALYGGVVRTLFADLSNRNYLIWSGPAVEATAWYLKALKLRERPLECVATYWPILSHRGQTLRHFAQP